VVLRRRNRCSPFDGSVAEFRGVSHAIPSGGGSRRLPTQFTDRRLRKGQTEEPVDAVLFCAAEKSLLYPDVPHQHGLSSANDDGMQGRRLPPIQKFW